MSEHSTSYHGPHVMLTIEEAKVVRHHLSPLPTLTPAEAAIMRKIDVALNTDLKLRTPLK